MRSNGKKRLYIREEHRNATKKEREEGGGDLKQVGGQVAVEVGGRGGAVGGC